MSPARPIPWTPQVAVVGCGNWGQHLVRIFSALGALRAVVDTDPDRAAAMTARYGVPAVGLDAVLADPAVEAVAVAVPAAAHFAVADRSLAARKHTFVEKPLALDLGEATLLCQRADSNGLVLMVGHLLRYHPAFVALRRLVGDGILGRLRYLYSNRLNLGRIRTEEDSLWSFAPHDVSMILALVGSEPEQITATGAAWVNPQVADVTVTQLWFPGGERAHIFVSWLHPFKEQKLIVVGDEAMAVFDDGEPWSSKLRLFRHCVSQRDGVPLVVSAEGEAVPLDAGEPLKAECRHFLDCVAAGATPDTDGREGLRVLRVLAAAAISVADSGRAGTSEKFGASPSRADVAHPGVMVHRSAWVDEPVEIGAGTRIWHFSHVLAGSRIGRDCTIGQNVMVGPRARVGDRCKIQNNVSVYEGVTLEDEVFCGPGCVFTNVANPRATVDRRGEFLPTRVGQGATIGANATILCGTTIGHWSFIAAGAVVTRDVPAHALMAGVPARRIGWMSHDGERLGDDRACPRSGRRYALTAPDVLVEAGDAAADLEEGSPRVVELVDLRAQRRRLGSRLDRAIAGVVAHAHFVSGPEVGRLEEELARQSGARHAVTCASGTDALLLALLSWDVGPGDAVLVPAFTFAATAEAVFRAGATPVFVDVDPDTFCLDPASLLATLDALARGGARPVGVIAVDLFGHPADYDAIAELAALRGLWVLADASQSYGSELAGRRVGTLAEVTATSFFPAKPLGCYGDGGAVLTDKDELAGRVRMLRAHGRAEGRFARAGLNSRLDTIQAAVLLEKMCVLDDELAARQRVADRYHEGLQDVVAVPELRPGVRSTWACYTIRSPRRDELAASLARERIATAIYYPRPLHAEPAYRRCPTAPGGLAVSEALSQVALSLPMHAYLEPAVQNRVIGAVRAAIGPAPEAAHK